MTITIRPVSTIEFIGLSETNTIGFIRYNYTEQRHEKNKNTPSAHACGFPLRQMERSSP